MPRDGVRGAAVALSLGAALSAVAAPQLYEMTTETGMPHLETSLRHAVVSETRCLDPADLSSAFWMLDDVSLRDCRLVKAGDTDYRLACTGGHGSSGDARWEIGPQSLAGTLRVRLGGKNMTFYQRITARVVGACPPR